MSTQTLGSSALACGVSQAGSATIVPGEGTNRTACISLANAIYHEGGSESSSGSSSDWLSTATEAKAQRWCTAGAGNHQSRPQQTLDWNSDLHHSHFAGEGPNARSLEDLLALSTRSCAEEDIAPPVRLSLAQILDKRDAKSAPSNSVAGLENTQDTRVRNDGTIALSLALGDELPGAGRKSSPVAVIGGGSHQHIVTKAISLLDAVSPPAPRTAYNVAGPSTIAMACPGPKRLLLAEHLVKEDPGDVKEDFLATPLPFVGAVVPGTGRIHNSI